MATQYGPNRGSTQHHSAMQTRPNPIVSTTMSIGDATGIVDRCHDPLVNLSVGIAVGMKGSGRIRPRSPHSPPHGLAWLCVIAAGVCAAAAAVGARHRSKEEI